MVAHVIEQAVTIVTSGKDGVGVGTGKDQGSILSQNKVGGLGVVGRGQGKGWREREKTLH